MSYYMMFSCDKRRGKVALPVSYTSHNYVRSNKLANHEHSNKHKVEFT